MKKLLLLILILIPTFCYPQIVKEKFDQGTVGIWNGEEWQWTEWEACNLLCVIDWNNDNIKVYSETLQDYDIITTEKEVVDEDGWSTFEFTAIDANGTKCGVFLLKDKNFDRWIGIEYSDTRIMYHIKSD
jgi:hypothetical protein